MNYYGYDFIRESDLTHHGIKGQKWGQRRFQNEDGTWTAAGKERYGDGNESSRFLKGSSLRATSSSKNAAKTQKTNDPEHQKRVENFKKAAKIGAAVAGTVLVAYGAYRLNNKATAALMDSYSDVGKVFLNSSLNQEKIASMQMDFADRAKIRGSHDLEKALSNSATYARKLGELDSAEASKLLNKAKINGFSKKERVRAAAKILTKGTDDFKDSKKEEIFNESLKRMKEEKYKLHGRM